MKGKSRKREESEDIIISGVGNSLEMVRLLGDLQPGGMFLEDKTQLSCSRKSDEKSKSARRSDPDYDKDACAGKTKDEGEIDSEEGLRTAIEISDQGENSDERKPGDEQRQSDEIFSDIVKSKKEGKKSFRAKIVHTPSRRAAPTADDRTLRCERYFLRRIERHKHRRLERYCICPVTRWLLLKEKMSHVCSFFRRTGRCCWILCCPPLCYTMPQVALWPPAKEYFFYVDNVPPRERREIEGRKEAIEIAERKKKIPKIYRANKVHKSDVYSYDYSGYGISSGHACESNVKADIRAVYEHMLNERGIQPDQIILIGYSIGCFASVDLACSIAQPPAGIILQSPPTSVLRVLLWERACFSKPFQQRSCCADRFCTYDKIAGVRVPVLVIHGEDDRTVPLIHGKAVCEKAVNR
ncbi:hypothetical protein GCK32_007444, partial [Trichostrongylus colubriformis]